MNNMNDERPLLQIRDLSASFGTGPDEVKAVHGVSLDIHKGETLGLVGESGSGKEVVARIVHDLSSRKDQPLRRSILIIM